MSDRFKIYRERDHDSPSNWGFWVMDYPDGFDEFIDGECCLTFEEAIAAFIEASEKRCITCDKGAVVDTNWGWECTACGSYDVARGCVRP